MTMNANDPYTIEYYDIALGGESDPNPTLEYTCVSPHDISKPVIALLRAMPNVYEVNVVDDLNATPDDELTSIYAVYVNGHESSHGRRVGTMFVMSVS